MNRKRALTPATLIMWVIVVSMLAVFFATRFTLDYTGPVIVDWLRSMGWA